MWLLIHKCQLISGFSAPFATTEMEFLLFFLNKSRRRGPRMAINIERCFISAYSKCVDFFFSSGYLHRMDEIPSNDVKFFRYSCKCFE